MPLNGEALKTTSIYIVVYKISEKKKKKKKSRLHAVGQKRPVIA